MITDKGRCKVRECTIASCLFFEFIVRNLHAQKFRHFSTLSEWVHQATRHEVPVNSPSGPSKLKPAEAVSQRWTLTKDAADAFSKGATYVAARGGRCADLRAGHAQRGAALPLARGCAPGIFFAAPNPDGPPRPPKWWSGGPPAPIG